MLQAEPTHRGGEQGSVCRSRCFFGIRRDLRSRWQRTGGLGELLPENRSRQEVSFPDGRDGRRTRHEEEALQRRADHRDLERSGRGATAVEVCRRHGISETTFYRWKAKFGGLTVSEAKRLRQLEAENSRLKRLLAEAHLDNAALKDLLAKNW
jgi:putative transposase